MFLSRLLFKGDYGQRFHIHPTERRFPCAGQSVDWSFLCHDEGGLQMADDKKNIPETAPPAETSDLELVLTDAEAVMLEHEG